MKIKTLLCLALCLITFSCKKDIKNTADSTSATNTQNVKTVDVTYKVSTGITGSKSGLSTATINRSVVWMPVNTQFVTALFYDAQGVIIKRIDQNSSQPDYGTIKIKLPIGKLVHAFFIAAADSSFVITTGGGNPDNLKTYPNGYPKLRYRNTVDPPNAEIYTTQKDYTVIYPISEEVQLLRAVSKITVTLNDVLPTSAANQYLGIALSAYSTDLDLVNRIAEKPYYQSTFIGLPPAPTPAEIGKTGFTRTKYIWPVSASTIQIGDGNFTSGNIAVPDGQFAANNQYVFTGLLFADTRQYFGFSINADWELPITVPISVPVSTSNSPKSAH